jgi:hypothetical protein
MWCTTTPQAGRYLDAQQVEIEATGDC